MNLVTCPKCGAKNRVKADTTPKLQAKCGQCGTTLPVEVNNDGKPISVTDANFEQTLVSAGSIPILVDCWAPWCGPCRMIGPIMEELAKDAGGRYQIGKLNVDENPLTAERYQISSIPTLLLFKGGNLIDRIIGAQPKQAIAARLARAV